MYKYFVPDGTYVAPPLGFSTDISSSNGKAFYKSRLCISGLKDQLIPAQGNALVTSVFFFSK